MNKSPLEVAKEALDKALAQKRQNQELISSFGPAIVETLTPVLNEMSNNTKLSKEELLNAIANIKINVPKADVPQAQVDVKIPEIIVPEPRVTVNIPEIKAPKIPEIKIPKITVPKPEVTVNVPQIKVPQLEWPDGVMSVEGRVGLAGIDLSNPLPVQLRDAKGKPVDMAASIISGGGGGKNFLGRLDNERRVVMTPVQVRGQRQTAYATLSNGTETTLLSGTANNYYDLVYIMAANNSSVSVTLNVRDCVGGGVVQTIQVPANGTAGVASPAPFPQNEAGNAWTVDMPDITGTTVYVSALFSKETI